MPFKKILIADDHAAVRRLISKVIERPGRSLAEAEDGSSAFAAWQEGAFSLLILDHVMPRLTGLEVARRVRSAGDLVPIVLISGAFDAEIRQEAELLEGVTCVRKPFALSELRGPVDRLLQSASEVPDLRLGTLGLRRGWLTANQLENALAVQSRHSKKGDSRPRIGRVLVAEGYLREDQVDVLLKKQRALHAELRS